MKFQLEICATTIHSAINAERGGAHRIELCDNLWEGGTTPSHASIEKAIEQLSIPVFVLIRPRGGDFTYTDLEFDLMKREIEHCKQLGVGGIVSGVLLPDGAIDKVRTKILMEQSEGLPFTFHRAFDQVPDPISALDDLIELDVDRVLTSVQECTAAKGKALIGDLIKFAQDQLIILPGGGINIDNIESLVKVGCTEFHLSAKEYVQRNSIYPIKVPMNGSADIPEEKLTVSSIEKIRQLRSTLDEKA